MEKTKKSLSITIDQKLFDLVDKNIHNRSKYIEWLIYQDLLKSDKSEKIKGVVI